MRQRNKPLHDHQFEANAAKRKSWWKEHWYIWIEVIVGVIGILLCVLK